MRRQARLSEADFAVLSDDLERFDLRDIEAACDDIGTRPRKDGELAFPDLGTLVAFIRDKEARRNPKNQYLEEMTEYRRQARENPDGFVNLREDADFAALLKRHGIGVDALLTDRKEPA